jgi:photosystem II stability/assembly factor-like uncharacterized protein
MRYLLLYLLVSAGLYLPAQELYKPSPPVIQSLPEWAKIMYGDHPNVYTVDSLYTDWFSNHPFIKDYHTEYYRIWRHKVVNTLNADGSIYTPTVEEIKARFKKQITANVRLQNTWSMVGPEKVFGENGNRIGEQTNVYAIDQSQSQANVLYCGTEPGEIYKSIDSGSNWSLTSLTIGALSGITAIAIDPKNPDIVYAGETNTILKTTDGGLNWLPILVQNNIGVNELLINPLNPQIVMAACSEGMYRTTDGGVTWTSIYGTPCYDIKFRPNNLNVVYLLKNNPTSRICEFLRSTDGGVSFTVQSNGWYNSTNVARQDFGARLAVTPADSLRIYAYLIGDSKPNDYGFIGVYSSLDGGTNWTLPNGPTGGPYTATHPNLAYGDPSWTYHQGFYNCAIMASTTDPDKILIGGLNLWRSNDGGQTFSAVAGYIGGPLDIHVDMQDFRATPNGYWITNDGGIYFSSDFFVNSNSVQMDGIHGSEFWGFGTGWNEDIMVGGLYHNGTAAWHENYAANNYLGLGGAEPASGYVNPGESRRVYSSDIGGAILPAAIGQPIERFSVGLWPNESYFSAESGRMDFDPRCWNIVYIGNGNKLWKSVDGGASYNLLYTFGTSAASKIIQTEISWNNPNIIYTCQHGSGGKVWRTSDGGNNWTSLMLPLPGTGGNRNRLLISLSPIDSNLLWLAYPSGANGNKIFFTADGGATWTNVTDTALDNQEVRWIQHIGNTNGGVYCLTNQTLYYRNNSSAGWQVDNSGLPSYVNGLSVKPFYRDGKMRLSTYGRGVWESLLQDNPVRPVAQPQVDKLNYSVNCEADTFRFEDHSVLNHSGAVWQWSFPGGSPSSSTLRNPKVVYGTPGTYTANLRVTDSAGFSDSASLAVTVSAYQVNSNLVETFQGSFPPQGWWSQTEPSAGLWVLSSAAGGYGNSTQSVVFDNYNFDAQGLSSDLRIRVNMTQQASASLFFDIAYAPYGGGNMDSLEVLVSTDCGVTFSSMYKQGGNQLATAPQLQNSTFIPSPSEWRTDSIDLSMWASEADVLIAFRNHGYYGQAIYVDNINFTLGSSLPETVYENGLDVLPNFSVNGQAFTLIAPEQEQIMVEVFASNGQLVHKGNYFGNNLLKLPVLSPGAYICRLTGDTVMRYRQIMIR